MDLETERSPIVKAEDNEMIAPLGFENRETESKVKDNGHVEHVGDNKLSDNVKVEANKGNFPSKSEPGGLIGPAQQPATKGRGLRKWRRKPRGVGKEISSSLDSNKKRGLTALPGDSKQRSNGSSSSTNAMVNLLGNALDFSALYGDSGMGSGGGPDFGARADSENSEDRNSRSSTAASGPRVELEMLPVVGLRLDENTIKSQPAGQQEKGRIGFSKKARGVKLRKENSQSSMESDSRSSNFIFLQGSNSVAGNGRQSGRSANYDLEYSDNVQHKKDAQPAFSKNEGESKGVLQEELAAENSWDVKEEKVDNHVGSTDQDALEESIKILNSAQEALQREVEKLTEIGKDDTTFEPQTDLQQNILDLQNKLKEAQTALELKEARVSELESALNPKNPITDLDELFRRKIEAEVTYIAMSKTIENFRAKTDDVSRLRHDAWKYASCFTFQVILLLVVVGLVVFKYSSSPPMEVPT